MQQGDPPPPARRKRHDQRLNRWMEQAELPPILSPLANARTCSFCSRDEGAGGRGVRFVPRRAGLILRNAHRLFIPRCLFLCAYHRKEKENQWALVGAGKELVAVRISARLRVNPGDDEEAPGRRTASEQTFNRPRAGLERPFAQGKWPSQHCAPAAEAGTGPDGERLRWRPNSNAQTVCRLRHSDGTSLRQEISKLIRL